MRVRRYLAKLTINPAITHGISGYVGSLQKGKMADIIIWSPPFFGIKPKIIIKGGFIAYSVMGDANASIPTTEPVYYRPMFGAMGEAKNSISVIFTSKMALSRGLKDRVRIGKKLVPVKNCRKIGKSDMILNNGLPKIDVDPESFIVRINGEVAETKPSKSLAMSRLYNLF
jgi:urease subunit alpha